MLEDMKQWLEALEKSLPRLAPYGEQDWLDCKAAITSLRKAIQEEALRNVQRIGQEIEQEPVAYEKQETEYKIGQKIKVTHLTYGAAVYNSKREVINANQPPHELSHIGHIVEIKQECENGAVVVRCEGKDKFLSRFQFYPKDNGNNQIVEVLEQVNTHPPQRTWVGLTDEDKRELDEKYGDDYLAHLDAVEAKLKEKNT
jgi:hypothetical protein